MKIVAKEQIVNVNEQLQNLITIYIQQPNKPDTRRFVGLAHPELSDKQIAQIMRIPDDWEIIRL